MEKIETGNIDFDKIINKDPLIQDIFKEIFKVHPRANKIKLIMPNFNSISEMGFTGPFKKYKKYLLNNFPYRFKIGNQYIYLYNTIGNNEKKKNYTHKSIVYNKNYLYRNGGIIDIYFRNKVI